MKQPTAKNTLISCLLLILSLTTLKAQNADLKGKIIDNITKEPISFCNVYLSGTSFGSLTNDNGDFIIQDLPPGEYTMIISHIGYENVIKTVRFFNGSTDLGNQGLTEVTYDISDEVLVESSEDRKWKSRFRKFSRFMMGYNFNAINIDFINAYVADFSREDLPSLRPSRQFTLEIENRYLGYRTNYLVTDFLIGGRLQYVVGYPSFDELEAKSKKEERKWSNNRLSAYEGSLSHFFKSLLENTLEENDFIVNITNLDPSVNLSHFDRVQSTANYSRALDPLKQNAQFKIENTDKANIKRITCKHIIEVYHLGVTDDYGESLQSYIKPMQDSFLVYTNGVLVNARSVNLFGHYAQKGLYDLLPFNYELTK